MSKVQPGSFLTLHYRLAGLDGGDVINTFNAKPATLSLGTGALSPAIEARLIGLIRVGGWEVRGQSYAPVWDRLPAPDVPKPGREPRTEINARFWAARRERMAANQQQLEAA